MLWTFLIGPGLIGAVTIFVTIKPGTDLAIFLFLGLSLRIRQPMLPIHDYSRFILEVRRVFPATSAG